ncbi:hypothetical protein [Lederbergia citrea]|uniref:Uncharacterized protein n=1 Tax=Lederbergia citrea TaxID=2833581 RepID=A0A942Z6D8_9BACI|nr:hypothetical protein [Lederbergia citrea]MBS4205743.1 hypothetical protein [Lederbergia citrea]MBS4223921.1 hypothetical protein [Lederbergia citrea]
MAVKKDELAEMVYYLSEKDIPLVYNLLTRLINQPKDEHIAYDNEPLTEKDLEAIKEAEEDYKHGRTIPFEEIEDDI